MDQNEISHYGVKGMHWGVRKNNDHAVAADAAVAVVKVKKKLDEAIPDEASPLKKREAAKALAITAAKTGASVTLSTTLIAVGLPPPVALVTSSALVAGGSEIVSNGAKYVNAVLEEEVRK